jgi:hypothetical protein
LCESAKRINGGGEKPQRDLIAYRYLGIDRNFGFVLKFAFLATFNGILLLSTGHSRERCSGRRNG